MQKQLTNSVEKGFDVQITEILADSYPFDDPRSFNTAHFTKPIFARPLTNVLVRTFSTASTLGHIKKFSHKRIIKTIAIQIVILMFCVAITEAFLWLFFPLPLELSEAVNQKVKQNLPGLKKEIIYKRNSFGFRAISMNTKKSPIVLNFLFRSFYN